MAVHFDIALPDDDCTVIDAYASDALPADVELMLFDRLRPRLVNLLEHYPRLDKRDAWPDLRA